MRARGWIVVACVLPGVVRAQDAAEPWPDGWRAPVARQCHALDFPGGVPALDKLGEIASVPSVLGWTEAAPPGSYAVWSVSFDSSGVLRRVVIVTTDLPDSIATRATAAVANLIDPQAAGASRTMQLRLELKGGAHFRTTRSEACEPLAVPSLQRRNEVSTATVKIAVPQGTRPTDAAVARAGEEQLRQYTAVVRVPVAADGSISASPEFARYSGNSNIDLSAKSEALRATYLPGLVDRAPVAGFALFTYKGMGAK